MYVLAFRFSHVLISASIRQLEFISGRSQTASSSRDLSLIFDVMAGL